MTSRRAATPPRLPLPGLGTGAEVGGAGSSQGGRCPPCTLPPGGSGLLDLMRFRDGEGGGVAGASIPTGTACPLPLHPELMAGSGGRRAPRRGCGGSAPAEQTTRAPDRRHLALALPGGEAGRWALWAMRFSPLVGVVGEDALVLDIGGSAHLFGGEAALLRRVVEGLAQLGVSACGVVAGAPGVALAVARAGRAGVVPPGGEVAAVDPLGLSALPLAPGVVQALSGMGLRRVGEVRRQPRGPLARRFGQALLRAIDEAVGEVVAPISPIRPPPEFEVARDLLDPLITRVAIDAGVAGLLESLCRRLAAAGRGARRVVLRAHRVDGAVQEVAVGTGLASRDPAHLGRLFAERLERLAPGFGFDRLALGAEVTEEMAGEQAGFMGAAAGLLRREELGRLFDRLSQRVEVWRLAPAASHWPEREVTRVAPTARVEVPPIWPRAPRPVRLLRRPLEVGAMALLPDAPPSLLRIGRQAHRVRAAEGPERLAPEWWRERPDRPGRDYYRVELASGARLWVCRSGFGAGARWFVHGRM
jgi:protein ImuB